MTKTQRNFTRRIVLSGPLAAPFVMARPTTTNLAKVMRIIRVVPLKVFMRGAA